MSYQSWDEVEQRLRMLVELRPRPEIYHSCVALLEIIKSLSQEFTFEAVRPHLSHGALVLNPVEGKTYICIGYPLQEDLYHVYRDISEPQGLLDEMFVSQEQVIPTIYEYIARLKAL